MTSRKTKRTANPADAAKVALGRRQDELGERMARIERSRRRREEPLPADSEERATESENDEVLDRLAETTERELAQVRRALARVAAGLYGFCERCERAIPAARLSAVPEATRCPDCAGANKGA